MKTYVFTIFALVLIAGTSCEQQVDIEKEKEAILAVITEETQAYCDKDFERFAACYVQDETNIRLLGGENEKMSYTVGWEKVGASFKELFENDPVPVQNNEVKKNFQFHIYKDCAWVVFEEEGYNDAGELTGKGIGTNILEKVDGKWKFVYLSRVHY